MNQAFERFETGNDQAIKDCSGIVINGLNGIVEMILGDLSPEMRTKIKTLITIEVHARDVLQRLIENRVESASDFAWQSQLKYRWDEEQRNCTPIPALVVDGERNLRRSGARS